MSWNFSRHFVRHDECEIFLFVYSLLIRASSLLSFNVACFTHTHTGTPPDVHQNVPKLIEDVLNGNLPLLDERQLGLDRQDEENEEDEVDNGPKEQSE